MYQRLRAFCERPRAPFAIYALAIALTSPALFVGLIGDDYIHGLILTGSQEIRAYAAHNWTRLFEFAGPAMNASLTADGILAWWADPQFKLSFFRPLSALTHWLDYRLWPHSPLLMHAHNLLFYVLALLAAFRLYERVLTPRWAAVLALFFYAVDPTRVITITWIANRNALIACALSSYAIVLHLKTIDGSGRSRSAGPLWFCAAMLAGEGAIGATAYLFAAELFFAKDAPARRALRLLPYALVVLLCVGAARALGYGVAGSGEYLDPIHNTAAFLSALPGRCLALLSAQFACFAAEWWNAYDLILPGLRGLFMVLALSALAYWAWLFTPLVRRSATARFFLCGSLLALLPAAATFPNGRTLGWVSIGVMGLAAEYFANVVDGVIAPKLGARIGAALILLLHGAYGAFSLPGGCWAVHEANQMLEHTDHAIPADMTITKRTVVFINPPQEPTVAFEPATRAFLGVPRPQTQRWLATGMSSLRVTRVDARSLEIEPRDGFVHEQTERVTRGSRPFELGQRITLPGLTIEITALTSDARPQRALFHFARPLEDPSYLWLAWHGEGFVPFQPPSLHNTIQIPRIDFATMVLGAKHPVTQALAKLRAAQLE